VRKVRKRFRGIGFALVVGKVANEVSSMFAVQRFVRALRLGLCPVGA
jgi:hypothetical protein